MIIAECGQNWRDFKQALSLIDIAKESGADLVKFQLYEHEKLYANHPEIPNKELSFKQAFDLFNHGKEIGIEVFFSVFDVERVNWCAKIGVKRYKIAHVHQSKSVIDAVRKTGKPWIISSGVAGIFGLRKDNEADYSVLYCPDGYPCEHFTFQIPGMFDGISDHTVGIDIAKIAIVLHSQIIEKHFALSHDPKDGIDAPWSMTPDELRELKRWEGICRQVM